LLAFNPAQLFSLFGRTIDFTSQDEITVTLASVCRYYGAASFCFAFLFLHYIPFKEKQKPGLMLGVMINVAYLIVAAWRISSPGASVGSINSAWITIQSLLPMAALSFLGMKLAPKKENEEKKKKKTKKS
jgi:hypothetical protein